MSASIRCALALLLGAASCATLAHGPVPHAPGKPHPVRAEGRNLAAADAKPADRQPAAPADAATHEPVQPRFCMKNRNGKMHCIPFGPAH